MVRNIFKGLGIALVTPFTEDGAVDYKSLIRLVEYQLDNGADFFCILTKYSIQLILIDDIGTKCNIIYILRVITKFQSADGIRDLGETIKNNAEELYKYIQVILTGETTEVKLYAVGQILALLFNYYVN